MLSEPLPKTMVKKVIATANRPMATQRLHRAIREDEGPHKVVLGCGRVRPDGWLHTDIAWNAPMYLDATRPWPFPPNSVGRIYADNMIEHVPVAAGRSVLRHAFAALQPGGVIRLATPDVERIARLYLEGATEFNLRCMEHDRRTGYDVHYPVDLLRNVFTAAGHEVGYQFDYSILSAELEAVGFVDVKRCEAGESEDEELRGLELRASDIEAARELIVEATKPREAGQASNAA